MFCFLLVLYCWFLCQSVSFISPQLFTIAETPVANYIKNINWNNFVKQCGQHRSQRRWRWTKKSLQHFKHKSSNNFVTYEIKLHPDNRSYIGNHTNSTMWTRSVVIFYCLWTAHKVHNNTSSRNVEDIRLYTVSHKVELQKINTNAHCCCATIK